MRWTNGSICVTERDRFAKSRRKQTCFGTNRMPMLHRYLANSSLCFRSSYPQRKVTTTRFERELLTGGFHLGSALHLMDEDFYIDANGLPLSVLRSVDQRYRICTRLLKDPTRVPSQFSSSINQILIYLDR